MSQKLVYLRRRRYFRSQSDNRFEPFFYSKELSLCHKLKFSPPYIFATWCSKSLIFQTWSSRICSFKYLRSTTLVCEDKGVRKSEFVENTHFLSYYFLDFTFGTRTIVSLMVYNGKISLNISEQTDQLD